MPQKRLLKRPQVNIVLTKPQMADVLLIMEERSILHLSDYVRQLVTRDIRQWRADHCAQFMQAKQRDTPEYQAFLKWKHRENEQPGQG